MLKIGEIKHIAAKNEILLDFDEKTTLLNQDWYNWCQLLEIAGLTPLDYHMESSSSGTGIHVIIRVKEKLKPLEQVAMQAILGSDPWREALNFRRRGLWNILFSKKIVLEDGKAKVL